MYTMVQELTKQTNARSQGKSLNITWAGASGFTPSLSAPEASTEDPSPLTAGALTNRSLTTQVCAMDTQLRLEGGVLYVGIKTFSASNGYKFSNILVFKDCMRAPKLPIVYVNIISQNHRLVDFGRELWRSSGPLPLLELEPVAQDQDQVQMASE